MNFFSLPTKLNSSEKAPLLGPWERMCSLIQRHLIIHPLRIVHRYIRRFRHLMERDHYRVTPELGPQILWVFSFIRPLLIRK